MAEASTILGFLMLIALLVLRIIKERRQNGSAVSDIEPKKYAVVNRTLNAGVQSLRRSS